MKFSFDQDDYDSGCKETIETLPSFPNDVAIPSDGSVVSAIRINDSFCESPKTKASIECEESNDESHPDTKRKRTVTFRKEIVTEKIELDRWSPEEKMYLFYTGKEMYKFRIEYMMELHSSLESKNDEWSGFTERGGIRLFWNMYAAVVEFFSCRAVAQFCCRGDTSN